MTLNNYLQVQEQSVYSVVGLKYLRIVKIDTIKNCEHMAQSSKGMNEECFHSVTGIISLCTICYYL